MKKNSFYLKIAVTCIKQLWKLIVRYQSIKIKQYTKIIWAKLDSIGCINDRMNHELMRFY